MKKMILFTAMIALCSTSVYSEQSNEQPPAPQAQTNTPTPTQAAPTEGKEQASQPSAPAEINCEYKIPAETTSIEPSLIKTWVEKATVQSFNYSAQTMDSEIEKLKVCYTKTGWEGFYKALEQSGNVNAIKTQNLTVSSQVNGDVKLVTSKDNQWRFSVPLEVVYQNDKQKLTQLLNVDVLVGRKASGDLGIMQMIAAPRVKPNSNTTPPAPQQETPASTNTPSEPQPETP